MDSKKKKKEEEQDDIAIENPDVGDASLEGAPPKPSGSISLDLSHTDKYKHILLKQQAGNAMRGKAVARRAGKSIRAAECAEIFYNTGDIYEGESKSYSGGSIAKTQAAVYATVEKGAFAILTDKDGNHYVFSLDTALASDDVALNGALTDVETVAAMPAGYRMDRLVTSDKSQLVPAGQYFASPAPADTSFIASLPFRVPVILVPGVMGSELVRGGVTVWPSTKEATVKSLELDANGDDVHGAVTASRVMRHFPVLGGLVQAKVYDGFFTFFTAAGYVEGTDLFGFAYDWRKDLQAAGKELEALVRQVAEASIYKKVVIVAHSLGGLVTRSFMLNPDNHKLVDKLFVIGTPHHGAPKYMSTLLFGKEWPLPWIAVKLSEPDAKTLVCNFASIYMGTLDHTAPYTLLYNDGAPVDVADLDKVMPGQFNTSLISKAIAFHDALNESWARYPFYQTHLMVSSKVPTITQIYMKKAKFDGYGTKGAGDETIPAFSSKRLAPDREHNRIYEFGKVTHQDLAVDRGVLQKILSIMYPSSVSLPSLHSGPLSVWELANADQGGRGPLARGDARKELVSHLQLLLVNLGHDLSYPGGPANGIDGDFGEITDRELKKFQQSHSDFKGSPLAADGAAGPLTADALNRAVLDTGIILPDDYFTPGALSLHYDKLKAGQPIP